MKSELYNTGILDKMTSESTRWMLSRYDSWRASIATRCSIVLSATALLLAGETFLLENIMSKEIAIQEGLFNVLVGAIALSTILLTLSLFYSTTGIANVFKSSREGTAKGTPNRLLFHPSDIINTSGSFEEFVQEYSIKSREEFDKALWSEIWSLVNMHHIRYQKLRKAIKYLVISIPIYLLAVVLILINSLLS